MSHYGPSREHVVEMCRTMLERGYLKATEGNVSVRVPGRRLLRHHAAQLRLRPDAGRGHLRRSTHGLHTLGGTTKASIEAGMHAAVYGRGPT